MVPILQRCLMVVMALGMMGSASAASLSTYAPNAYTYPVTQVEMRAAQLAQFIAQKRPDGVDEILFDGALALQVKKILDDLDSAAPAVMPDGEPGAYCKQVLATPVPVWHGGTVLHVAACYGYLQTIRVLCAAGASRSQPDMHGNLPMNIARIHMRSPCIYNVLDPAVNIDEVIAKFGMISVEYAGLTPLVPTVPCVGRRLNPTVAAWSPRQAPGDSGMVLPAPAIPAPVPEAAPVPVDPVQEACAQAKAELLALSDDYPHKYACTGQFKEFRLLVKAYERVPAGFLAKTPTGLTLLAAALLGGHNLVIDSLAKRSFQAGIVLLDDDTRALIARYKLEEPLKIFVRVLATEEANKEKKAKEAAAASSAVAAAARAAHTPSGAGVAPWRDTSVVAAPASASVPARRSPGSAGSPASGDREEAAAAPAVPAPVLAGGAGRAKSKNKSQKGCRGGGAGASAGDNDDIDAQLAKACNRAQAERAAVDSARLVAMDALITAIKENDAIRVNSILAADRTLACGVGSDGKSPLYYAVTLSQGLQFVPALVEYGSDPGEIIDGVPLRAIALSCADCTPAAKALELAVVYKQTSNRREKKAYLDVLRQYVESVGRQPIPDSGAIDITMVSRLLDWIRTGERAVVCSVLPTLNKATQCALAARVLTEADETLLFAGLRHELAYVKALITAGSDVNKVVCGRTPLREAIRYGRVDMVDLLLKHGARVDLPGVISPLQAVVEYLDGEVAQQITNMLLDASADPCVTWLDSHAERKTLAQLARERSKGGLGDFLERAAAVRAEENAARAAAGVEGVRDGWKLDASGKNALHHAIIIGDLVACAKLLEFADDKKHVDDRDSDGKSPLHLIVERVTGDLALDMVRVLVNAGANPLVLCHGKTPQELAMAHGRAALKVVFFAAEERFKRK